MENSNDWIKNTPANPFYKNPGPVEVKTKIGTTKIFTCPSCGRGWMSQVTEWRPIKKP